MTEMPRTNRNEYRIARMKVPNDRDQLLPNNCLMVQYDTMK